MLNQKGFTLIELIAVLIILAVLSAVAIPRYIDLQSNAENKFINMVLAEFNVKESMAYNNARLSDTEYVSPIADKEEQLSPGLIVKPNGEESRIVVFTGGDGYPVYRWDYKDSDGGFYKPSTWSLIEQTDDPSSDKGKGNGRGGGNNGKGVGNTGPGNQGNNSDNGNAGGNK
jgi:prepilin-type N-terminal cleavage/methylation domain-containing protein